MIDTIKILVTVDTGFAGCVHEEEVVLSKDWWDGATEDQKENEIREVALERIEWTYEVIDK